jgi:hypothetical protein
VQEVNGQRFAKIPKIDQRSGFEKQYHDQVRRAQMGGNSQYDNYLAQKYLEQE